MTDYGEGQTVDYQATYFHFETERRRRWIARVDAELHPAGSCTCLGEGRFTWCQESEAREHQLCDEWDEILPGETLVDELRDEVRELEQTLACERSELDQARRLSALLGDVVTAYSTYSGGAEDHNRSVEEAGHRLNNEMPDWQELVAEWRKG